MRPTTEQGIYRWGNKIIYLAFCPGNDKWYYQPLHYGTKIGTYSTMRMALDFIFTYHTNPIVLTHLMPGTVVSDLYPELFI